MGSGCPGRLIAMRMKEGKGDRGVIRVVFKADCNHSPDSTATTQPRGALWKDLVHAVASAPASIHAAATGARSAEWQLSGDVSTSGGTPQVVRQTAYQVRALECRFDKDVLSSVLLRNRGGGGSRPRGYSPSGSQAEAVCRGYPLLLHWVWRAFHSHADY